MESFVGALPFLLFLACPVMMVFCMRGMRKAGCSTSKPGETQGSREERIAALEGQLATIQTELTALHTAEATPSSAVSREANGSGVTQLPEVAHASQGSI